MYSDDQTTTLVSEMMSDVACAIRQGQIALELWRGDGCSSHPGDGPSPLPPSMWLVVCGMSSDVPHECSEVGVEEALEDEDI